MSQARQVLWLLPVLLLLIPQSSFADSVGSIAVTFAYTNGDTADYGPISLKIYQDSGQIPYRNIESVAGNPFNIVSLPTNHQYKIDAYANSMYASSTYVSLQQAHQDVAIKIPLPGGMRINAFYNDGVSPIANATVYIRSADNKTWGHSVTNSDGDSLRFWIAPTVSTDDHYTVDVHVGSHLSYSTSPVYLRPGIPQEIKVTTGWPKIVNSLVTARIFNYQMHPVGPSDGKFTAILLDAGGNKVSESPVTSRGEAYFSNLGIGDYTIKITREGSNATWASTNMTEDGTVMSVQVAQVQNATAAVPPSSTRPAPPQAPAPPPPMPSCGCVVFRLDNIQDYWLDDVQIKIIDSFYTKNAGITVGVIGKAFGNDSALVSYLKPKAGHGSVDVAINGWSFEDFSTLPRDQQASLLQQSSARISGLLGVVPEVFIPPYARADSDTVYAAAGSSINTISGSPSLVIPQDMAGKIRSYPANIFSGVLAQNTDQGTLNDRLMSSIRDAIHASGYAMVTLNFQDYAEGNGTKANVPDTAKIQGLQTLIDTIRDSGYRITTASDMSGLFKPQAQWESGTYQWANGKAKDADFLAQVGSMVQQGTIHGTLPERGFTKVPSWVREDAVMYSQGQISDEEFLNAVEYLVGIHAIK